MDLDNPLALPLIIVGTILAIGVLLLLFKLATKITWFRSKWLSFGKESPIEKELAEMKVKMEELEKKSRTNEAEIYLVNKKIEQKSEFGNKLKKLIKSYQRKVLENVEIFYTDKFGFTTTLLRDLDEYDFCNSYSEYIRFALVRKGMDDFDNNGFHKIGSDAYGNFDNTKFFEYLTSKPKEYEFEIRDVATKYNHTSSTLTQYPVEPSTVGTKVYGLTTEDFLKICIESFEEFHKPIMSLYEDLITGAKLVKMKYVQLRTGGPIDAKIFT